MRAVSCRDDNDTSDDAERRDDDAMLAAVQVADNADSELAEDGADGERVGQTSRDRTRVLFAIDLSEDDIRESHDYRTERGQRLTESGWADERAKIKKSEKKKRAYYCSANHRR